MEISRRLEFRVGHQSRRPQDLGHLVPNLKTFCAASHAIEVVDLYNIRLEPSQVALGWRGQEIVV